MLLLAAGGGGYWLGYQAAMPAVAQKAERLEVAHRGLAQQVKKLRAERQRLLSRNLHLRRAAQIDHNAMADVRGSLRELQGRVSKLQARVAFYRSIVSPSANGNVVKASSFDVYPLGKNRIYAFTLTVIQSGQHRHRARGSVHLSLKGAKEGKPAQVAMKNLLVGKSKSLRFSFHYFEELDGKLKLPEGFQPETVVVRIDPQDRKADERHYPWIKVIRDGSS